MTVEERVMDFALSEIEKEYEAAKAEYEERLSACYEEARENGQEIEQVVNNGMLWDNLMANVADTRKYWVRRLEDQGASLETIRGIDPYYEPEKEASDGGGYVAF